MTNNYSVPAVERAARILSALSKTPGQTVSELSASLEINKSTVFTILQTLSQVGYVERQDNRYDLGLGLFHLGSLVLERMELRGRARPVLEELTARSGLTSHLAILQDKAAVYVEKVESPGFVKFSSSVGRRMPLHCTGVGKALVLDCSLQQLRERLPIPLQRRTPKTLDSLDDLWKDLAGSRERGWTLDDEEDEELVRCIGAPVRDHKGEIRASISVTGLTEMLRDGSLEAAGRQVVEAAAEISERIGYRQAEAPGLLKAGRAK